MGKLFSKPKMPTIPQVKPTEEQVDSVTSTLLPPTETETTTTATATDPGEAQAPIAPSSATSTPDVAASTQETAKQDDQGEDEDEDARRIRSILARRKGRAGTIATSWNGILTSASTSASGRKQLLGE